MNILARRCVSWWLSATFLATLLILSPSRCLAADGEGIIFGNAGNFKIRAALAATETYDSNILRANTDTKDDFIAAFYPSVDFQARMVDALVLGLQADAGLFNYAQYDEENYQTWNLSAGLEAKYPRGLEFEIRDTFSRDHRNRIEYIREYFTVNKPYAMVAWATDQFKIEGEFFNHDFNYQKSDSLDRRENMGALTCFYRFLPKTSVLLEVDYADIAYKDSLYAVKDNRVVQVRGGLTWEITGKTTGDLRLGMQRKDYEDAAIDDANTFVVDGRVKTDLTPETSVDVDLLRGTFETDYSNNSYYASSRVTVGLTHKLRDTISLLGSIHAQMDQYPESSTEGTKTARRDESYYGANVGLEFRMLRWLTFRGEYTYETRNSNFAAYDFNDHRVTLGVAAAF